MVITNVAGSVTSSAATLAIVFTNPVVLAQWNFNSVPAGQQHHHRHRPRRPMGNGTASLAGGTTATFATGDASLDPAGSTDNSAWNTAPTLRPR